MSGSLIPNAKQQYLDANGNPLAGGFVYYYIPSTTTFKNTYQDAALTILNSNPIILDSAGECITYGDGSYRQIVTDVNGNLIWDQPTVTCATVSYVDSKIAALGTMAVQNANSVSITGGTMNGVTGTNSGMTVGVATTANNLLNNNWATSSAQTINTFTGAISATTLTVSATSVIVRLGSILSGSSVTANTQITNQLTSTGAAVVSPTYSSGGEIGAYVIVLSSSTSIAIGQLVSGTGVPSNTLVTGINGSTITLSKSFTVQAAGTYNFYTTGGVGTYTVNTSQTTASTTITQNYAKLNFAYNGNNVAVVDPLGNLVVNSVSQTTTPKLGLGITGESWKDVSATRSPNINYVNSNNYPISICVSCSFSSGSAMTGVVNGVDVIFSGFHAATELGNISFIVPTGANYQVRSLDSLTSISWIELY
jgi:hypothetical protein